MTGVILIIIGLAFLLKNLGVISAGAWGFIWPALLIALGVWLLVERRGRGDGALYLEERLGIGRRR
jgi:membrane-bound ClpP family serine protease